MPSVTKNEEFVQLHSEIKNTIKNLVNEKNKIAKDRNENAKIMQQIKAEYQKVPAENERLKKYVQQYENEKKKSTVLSKTNLSKTL